MPGPAAAIGGGSALLGASSSRKAAKSQERAANSQLELEGRIYDETKERFQPFYDSGLNYQNVLNFELLGGDRPMVGGDPQRVVEFTDQVYGDGSMKDVVHNAGWSDEYTEQVRDYGPRDVTRYRVGDQTFGDRAAADAYAKANPTGGTEYGGFEATPYQKYVLQTSQDQIDGSAASQGSLFSGATIKAQQDRANDLSGAFYGNYIDRLTGQAAQGQAAAANLANAGANYASGGANALSAIGNAQAAGAIGVGNAFAKGVDQTVGIWNYQNQTSGATPQPANALSAPWASGGFWG
ncbi:hypothetical protein [Phaeobacter gallaeciensis]|uniref:DNA transfer protein p32 n=1 Tax=Phaeobacter gallaeciensis TaxID=60890 RepID=A0AAC9Z8P1_9RHOB|nr:hypothetical protein [Phaeobacter gallaeciensis]AHD10003.1 hypothetical protein Gal_02256 [Phaeobacter gallaeciensis DSM 26640]ATE93267.1 hypothetical protein PhaeoP11_02247 [Phaeobacter gallaeciensis]ATE96912.1 hypothetical protein PhaeoP73_01600 [Phaeobacter gallaeciensis]ATF01931.1 hypothetical protein PhaeoP75_02296 [Phaeobacter gallaeciensis]ATF06311.1 hypothetical protein PhaeoP63_02245 [Phaeobacter gallaeciensis]